MIVFCGGFSTAHAQQSISFNAIQYRPSPFVDRVFTVDGAGVQNPKKAFIGFDFDISDGSMTLVNRAGREQDVIGGLLVAHFLASYGIGERVNMGIEFPFALYEAFTSPTTRALDKRIRMGDLLLAMKVVVLPEPKYPVGIAVAPFIVFPTGSGDSFVGNDSFSGGGKFIISRSFSDKIRASFNLGYLMRYEANVLMREIDDMFLYGLGVSWRVARDFTLLGEAQGSTVADNAFRSQNQSPLEVDFGVGYDLPLSRFGFLLGGGAGIINNNGAPVYRVSWGINYQFGKKIIIPEKKKKRRPVLDSRKNLRSVVYFPRGGTKLTLKAKRDLKELSMLMKDNKAPTASVILAGCADDAETNKFELHVKQAEVVREYLAETGADPERTHIVGYAEDFPEEIIDTQ